MNEAFLPVYLSLFILMSVILFLYFRRIREVSIEYNRARTVLDDIILSFNNDLRKQEEEIRDIADKSEQTSSENREKIDEIKSNVSEIMVQLMNLINTRKTLLDNYEEVQKKIHDIVSKRSEILSKINKLEFLEESVELADRTIESAIPIRKEEALAPLTETELKILNFLSSEGDKTSPQIKDRIHLTREHTARLMKKLFSQGYVERKTDRIPYVYSLKKEMEKLLGNQRAGD